MDALIWRKTDEKVNGHNIFKLDVRIYVPKQRQLERTTSISYYIVLNINTINIFLFTNIYE